MQRWFWSNFFRLTVITASLAQWICAVWLLENLAGLELGPAAHLAGVVMLLAANPYLRHQRASTLGAPRRFLRVYAATAFTALFGLGVLALTSVVWGVGAAGWKAAELAGFPVAWNSLHEGVRMLGTGGLLATTAAMAWGYSRGQARVHIQPLEVTMPHLPAAMDGFHVVQLSDIHLGPFMDAQRMAGYAERANALKPDLIVITGDITDGLQHAPETFPALGRLRARFGVLAILGNHDFYTGADDVEAALARWTDFRVLRDRRMPVETPAGTLEVLGMDDRGQDWTRGPAAHPVLDALMAQVPTERPTLLLNHRPDIFPHAAELGIGLVLAGHTHGGQIALPWPRRPEPSLARFISAFPRGTHRIDDSTLHVNLGLGVTAQPVRLASPREITSIVLRAPSARS